MFQVRTNLRKAAAIIACLAAIILSGCGEDEPDKIPTYTVTFDAAGGSSVDVQTVEDGTQAKAPANPTRDGYEFLYWTLNGEQYVFSKPVTGNITLTAKWQEITADTEYWQVQWILGGGAWPESDNHVNKVIRGNTLAEPNAPVKEGATFDGWYNGSTVWDFDNVAVTGDLTLTAQWVEAVTSYTVTFDADGGTPAPESQEVKEGGKVMKPVTPVKDGLEFDGWMNGEAAWDFETGTVTGDLTLKAAWTEAVIYTVTFDADGGTPAPESQDVKEGGKVMKPVTPVKEGLEFDGWMNGEATWDFETGTVTGNLALKAAWKVRGYEFKDYYGTWLYYYIQSEYTLTSITIKISANEFYVRKHSFAFGQVAEYYEYKISYSQVFNCTLGDLKGYHITGTVTQIQGNYPGNGEKVAESVFLTDDPSILSWIPHGSYSGNEILTRQPEE